MDRSIQQITIDDLKKIYRLAQTDIDDFFERKPEYAQLYKEKKVLVALCQGGALHYIDGKNGVKDFDVWFFYPQESKPLPYRRRGTVDFGESKFGKFSGDQGFVGRRIDVLMRSDKHFKEGEPAESIRRYLLSGSSKTSKALAEKAVVGLYPDPLLGEVLWPINC